MRFSFLRSILVISALLAAVIYYPLSVWLTPDHLGTVIASGLIAFGNIVIGMVTLELFMEKPHSPFMIAVFGGMGIRMMLILAAFGVLLSYDHDSVVLALSLMGFYIVYMIAEIVYVMKVLGGRKVKLQPKRAAGRNSIVSRTLITEQAKH